MFLSQGPKTNKISLFFLLLSNELKTFYARLTKPERKITLQKSEEDMPPSPSVAWVLSNLLENVSTFDNISIINNESGIKKEKDNESLNK